MNCVEEGMAEGFNFDGLRKNIIINKNPTRPDSVLELGDSSLFARVRTLCFKSLFMHA